MEPLFADYSEEITAFENEEIFEYDHLDAFLSVDIVQDGLGFFIGRREDCVSIVLPENDAKVLHNALTEVLGRTL